MLVIGAVAIVVLAVAGLVASPIARVFCGMSAALGGDGGQGCAPSCYAILQGNSSAQSGIYGLYVSGQHLNVYCDMTTNGGGWALVMRASGGDPVASGNPSPWNSMTGAYNVTANPSPTGSTFKYADSVINALQVNKLIRLTSDGVYAITRFVGGCTYAHATPSSGNCISTYSDVNLTMNKATASSVPSGVSDFNSAIPALYFWTNNTGGAAHAWNTGNYVTNIWCNGNNANCNFTMWVR